MWGAHDGDGKTGHRETTLWGIPGGGGYWFQNGIHSQIQDYRFSSKLHSLHGLENTWEKEIALHDLIDIKNPVKSLELDVPPGKDNSQIELACTGSHSYQSCPRERKARGTPFSHITSEEITPRRANTSAAL